MIGRMSGSGSVSIPAADSSDEIQDDLEKLGPWERIRASIGLRLAQESEDEAEANEAEEEQRETEVMLVDDQQKLQNDVVESWKGLTFTSRSRKV